MSWSKSIALYADIAAHLDMIASTNARKCTFATPAQAQLWRSRVYMYRAILRESAGDGRSQYDRFVFRIIKADPLTIHILEGYPDSITFHTADGSPIEYLEREPLSPEDQRLADDLRKSIEKRGIKFDDDEIPPPDITPQSLDDLGL